jgi:hypothetical protein
MREKTRGRIKQDFWAGDEHFCIKKQKGFQPRLAEMA